MISKRAFVSFDEFCPFQCKHCFTYEIKREKFRTIEEIVNSIDSEDFDVVYISQKNDNFSNPEKGLELCRQLFEKYKCHMFIITRNVLNKDQLHELLDLNRRMEEVNKQLFIAVSLNATDSIGVCENTYKVPTPDERVAFLKELSEIGLCPILMIRPVFPDSLIPVTECEKLIESTREYISCVVSSGLGINEFILKRLNVKESEFSYKKDQEYLQGAINCEIKFIDVDEELKRIYKKCESLTVPIFEHSMPALNYIADKALS